MPIMLLPKDVIKKSYLKQKLTDKEFENFKDALANFSSNIKENDEEFNKTLLKELLEKSFDYSSYKINTKDKIDLAIYKNDTAEVILELKAPNNKSEMITINNFNKKAFHEALLYYLREKLKNKNFNLKHIIISNSIEWFVFDVVEFNKISTHKKIEKLYKDKEIYETLFSSNNDEFYRAIETILNDVDLLKSIKYSRFYLKDKQTNTQLKYIYKLLSPTHLLKLYSEDDSNTLNKNFYYELLHIMGLEETKEGSKKVIGRKTVSSRDDGSLLESTILKLRIEHDISDETRLFETALELNITWLNRILFLKLLEARLLTIHNGKYPKFLSYEIVDDFDKLNTLFFEILARRINEREAIRIEEFKNIPYLNSSLFEITPLERQYLKISELKNNTVLQKSSKTILKSEKKELSTIEYLLKFLNAYDFGSNETDEFKDEHNTLINSSVLGLIFEKLNGYKDGSFFTPSFVTMYMTKESIRKTVLDKFNKTFEIEAENFHELQAYCNRFFIKDEFLTKANDIVNSITIVDPAVGSGHFLVSALNELLNIKSELKILKGLNHIQITNENDELYIETQDGFFEYIQTKEGTFLKETQNIQELIFNEKLHIIENQLFGVDININSVKITQLRLWIELLKDSYYDENSELVTLPNIDINIKTGNSLVSKYPLKDSETKNKLLKEKLNDYKKYVKWYKETNDKAVKKEVVAKIEDIKKSFSQKLKDGSPELTEFKKLIQGFQPKDKKKYTKGYIEQFGFKGLSEEIIISFAKQEHCILYARFGKEFNPNDTSLFGDEIKLTAKEKKTQKTQATALLKKINKKYEIIKEFEDAEIFENSFEWRFEFPEVLDEDGEFVGFDIVIGNPPYVKLEKNYQIFFNLLKGNLNSYIAFIELGFSLLKPNSNLSYIVPTTFLSADGYLNFRNFLLEQRQVNKIIKLPYDIFDAYIDTAIIFFNNNSIKDNKLKLVDFKIHDKIIDFTKNEESVLQSDFLKFYKHRIIFGKIRSLLNKYYTHTINLEDIATINRGSLPPKDYCIVPYGTIDSMEWFSGQVYSYYIENNPNVSTYIIPEKLGEFKNRELFETPKIFIRQLISRKFRLQAMLYDKTIAFKKNIYAIYNINENYSKEYILALINSRFYSFVATKGNPAIQRDDFPALSLADVRTFIIPNIEETFQNKFVKIVNKIIEYKKQNKNTSKLECLIDKKVYSLYELDEEEINLIESAYNG